MTDNYVGRVVLFFLVALAGSTSAMALSCPPGDICQLEATLTFGDQVVGTISAGQLIQITFWDPPDFGPSISGDFRFDPRSTCSIATPKGSGCAMEILFTPTQVGQRTGQLTLIYVGGAPSGDLIQFWEFTGNGISSLPPPPPSPCDINKDGVVNVLDIQLEVREALGLSPGTDDLDGDKVVTVIDVQRVVNAALGLGCRVGR